LGWSDGVVLEVSGATVVRDGTDILAGIDWRVRRGEHWVIFGPNGAGKTTLLNLLTGYLWPTRGTVQIVGETLGEVEVRVLRQRVAVVSESVRLMMHDDLTGREVLVTGARGHLNLFEPPTGEELARADATGESVGLGPPLLEKEFGVMSTGERQRVMIARALVRKPEVLILDEPCAGLDIAAREFVLDTVEHACARRNAPSVLLTTHHVEEVTPCFTHALLLDGGRVFASGEIRQVLTSRLLSRLFGIPVEVHRLNGRLHAGRSA
jgi:iron complex transport system ATP-binding protein